MRVNVKLFATLRHDRGSEILMNEDEDTTVRDIIDKLMIPEKEAAIIFLNGRSISVEHTLTENDTVSIFPLVGGG